jgi:hypothetical protein
VDNECMCLYMKQSDGIGKREYKQAQEQEDAGEK